MKSTLNPASVKTLLGSTLFLLSGAAVAGEDGVVGRYTTSGALDTSFNGTGQHVSGGATDDQDRDVVVDSNGKVVACGRFVNSNGVHQLIVGRFNSNGTPDATFGWLGVSTVTWPRPTTAHAVAIDANGKILVLADEDQLGILVVRFNTNGAPDSTFSGDGIAQTDVAGSIETYGGDIAVASNGKIVVAGNAWTGTKPDFLLVRYNSNGTPDTTFSGDGLAQHDLGGTDYAIGLALESGGKIVVGGTSGLDISSIQMILARYTSAGALDTTFDTDGWLPVTFPAFTAAHGDSILIDSNGKYVVAGGAASATTSAFALARVNTNATFDTTFSGDGKQTATINPDTVGLRVKQATDGKLVMSGYTMSGSLFQMALMRFSSSGNLDTTFDGDGKVATGFSPLNGFGVGLALDGSNKPLVAGYRF